MKGNTLPIVLFALQWTMSFACHGSCEYAEPTDPNSGYPWWANCCADAFPDAWRGTGPPGGSTRYGTDALTGETYKTCGDSGNSGWASIPINGEDDQPLAVCCSGNSDGMSVMGDCALVDTYGTDAPDPSQGASIAVIDFTDSFGDRSDTCCHCNQAVRTELPPFSASGVESIKLYLEAHNSQRATFRDFSVCIQDSGNTCVGDPIAVTFEGSSNVDQAAGDDMWSDDIDISLDGDDIVLLATYFIICGPDYYVRWSTDTERSWLGADGQQLTQTFSGTGMNYYYQFSGIELFEAGAVVYPYWQLTVEQNTNNAYWCIGHIDFLDSNGNVISVAGATYDASSCGGDGDCSRTGSYGAGSAFSADGNTGDDYCSNWSTDNGYISIQFPSGILPSSIVMTPDVIADCPTHFHWTASEDGNTWVSAGISEEDFVWSGASTFAVDVELPTAEDAFTVHNLLPYVPVGDGSCQSSDASSMASIGSGVTIEECADLALNELTCGLGFAHDGSECQCGLIKTINSECLEVTTEDGTYSTYRLDSLDGLESTLEVVAGDTVVLDTDSTPIHRYDTVVIHAGGTVTASGNRPLQIEANTVIVDGTIDVSGGPGGNAGNDNPAAGGGGGGGALKISAEEITVSGEILSNGGKGGDAGGPGQGTFSDTTLWGDGSGGSGIAGGGNGGAGGQTNYAGNPGEGPGASDAGAFDGGVPPGPGGAGYATAGTDGFAQYSGNIQSGGPAYGDAELSYGLLGGSGAGGGGNDGDNEEGAGGGGSGGTIWLAATTLTITGTVSATGGVGGIDDYHYSGGDVLCCDNGGPGSDGRVRFDYTTFNSQGSTLTPTPYEADDYEWSLPSSYDEDRLAQYCGAENNTHTVDFEIDASRSYVDGDTAMLIIDFPGYMDVVTISYLESTEITDEWTIMMQDGCTQNNTATMSLTVDELMSATGASIVNGVMEFSLDTIFSYASYVQMLDSVTTVAVSKTLFFALEPPTTYTMVVEVELSQGSEILLDIQSHSATTSDGVPLVEVSFATFVLEHYEFNSAVEISSSYFDDDTSTITLTSTSAYNHPELGAGALQTWELTLRDPGACVDGLHSETVELDLQPNAAGEPAERVELTIRLTDEYREDCYMNIGNTGIEASYLVGLGDEMYDPLSETVEALVNQALDFYVEFDAAIVPATTALTTINVDQDFQDLCDDCLDQLEFSCDSCDSDGVTVGPYYNFSIGLPSSLFNVAADDASLVQFEMTFEFTYARRMLEEGSSSMKFPFKFLLRNYDCQNPSGLLAEKKDVACESGGFKTMFCSRHNAWEELTACSAETPVYAFPFSMVAKVLVSLGFVLMLWQFAQHSRNPKHVYSHVSEEEKETVP